jgi:hypothetical protein
MPSDFRWRNDCHSTAYQLIPQLRRSKGFRATCAQAAASSAERLHLEQV